VEHGPSAGADSSLLRPQPGRIENAPSGGLDYAAACYAAFGTAKYATIWTAPGGLGKLHSSDPRSPLLASATLSDCEDGLSNTIAVFEQSAQRVHYLSGTTHETEGDVTASAWLLFDKGGGSINWDLINLCSLWGVYSQHPHGAYALRADGSAQFLPQDLDPIVVGAIFTRENGEAISQP
jgi:hypothetical protein